MSALVAEHVVVYAQQVLSRLMVMARLSVMKIHASIAVLAYHLALYLQLTNKNQVKLGFFLA